MRRYIVLLLITGLVWAQTDFDKLVLKDGTTYLGEYSKTEGDVVYFKPQNVFAFQPISIKQIQTLKLKDGHFIIGEQLPVAIGDEFSVWLKSQEAIGTPIIEYMKLLGCTMVIILLINNFNEKWIYIFGFFH